MKRATNMRDSRGTRSVAPASGRAAASRWDELGFGLVEVIVAMTLFMLIAATTTPALVTAVRFSDSNAERVVAAALAAGQIDQARAQPLTPAMAPGSLTVVRNGTTFVINRELSISPGLEPATGCPTPAANSLLTIMVTVTWSGGSVKSDTLRAC